MRDDLQVTSELYRLMPPRRGQRSELREAPGAARGTTSLSTDDGDGRSQRPRPALPQAVRSAPRRTLVWLGNLVTLTLAGVLSLAIYDYLTRH